jgi:nucleoside phosphorylase
MLLICSAWQEEIQELENNPLLKQNPSIKTQTLGIGFLEAALRLQNILAADQSIDEVLFLGTAGIYSHANAESLGIGDLCKINSVKLLQAATVLGKAYVPLVYPSYDAALNSRVVDLSHSSLSPALCLSSLEITASKNLGQSVCEGAIGVYSSVNEDSERANNAEISQVRLSCLVVENMELYGVAKVVTERGLPWQSLLGITNYVHEAGHEEWQKSHKQVSKKLCDFALTLLE